MSNLGIVCVTLLLSVPYLVMAGVIVKLLNVISRQNRMLMADQARVDGPTGVAFARDIIRNEGQIPPKLHEYMAGLNNAEADKARENDVTPPDASGILERSHL